MEAPGPSCHQSLDDGILNSYFEKRVRVHGDPSAKETTLKRSRVCQTYFYAKNFSLFCHSYTRSPNENMSKLCLFLFSIPRWKTSFSSLVTSFSGLTKLAVLLKNKSRNNFQMLIEANMQLRTSVYLFKGSRATITNVASVHLTQTPVLVSSILIKLYLHCTKSIFKAVYKLQLPSTSCSSSMDTLIGKSLLKVKSNWISYQN